MLPEEKFKQIYNPKSNRLKNYDYSSNGGYFITICTKNRENYFGEIIDGKVILNDIGNIVEKYYLEIPKHFPFVILDEFMIMPNHIHGIIIICNEILQSVETKNLLSLQGGQIPRGTSKTIGSIIRGFKIGVTKYTSDNTDVFQVWQPNYYDRIIRNENELEKIRKYILENPLKRELDKNNTENIFM